MNLLKFQFWGLQVHTTHPLALRHVHSTPTQIRLVSWLVISLPVAQMASSQYKVFFSLHQSFCFLLLNRAMPWHRYLLRRHSWYPAFIFQLKSLMVSMYTNIEHAIISGIIARSECYVTWEILFPWSKIRARWPPGSSWNEEGILCYTIL